MLLQDSAYTSARVLVATDIEAQLLLLLEGSPLALGCGRAQGCMGPKITGYKALLPPAPLAIPPPFVRPVPPPPRGGGDGHEVTVPPLWRWGGGWHKASVSDCLPLAAPIGLSPLLSLTLCGSERVLVVSTEPPDEFSCLTTPGVGRLRDGAVARAIDQVTRSDQGGGLGTWTPPPHTCP